jgi:hypothetical protein
MSSLSGNIRHHLPCFASPQYQEDHD